MKKEWRVWAHFWTAPKAKKWADYSTQEEAAKAAKDLNSSPSGKYTHYFVGLAHNLSAVLIP